MLIFFIFVQSERWWVVLSPLRFMWKNIIFVIIHIIIIIETEPNEQVNYPPPFRYSKQKQRVYLREIYYLLNFYILKNGPPPYFLRKQGGKASQQLKFFCKFSPREAYNPVADPSLLTPHSSPIQPHVNKYRIMVA